MTREEFHKLKSDRLASGLSVYNFCQQRGISESGYYKWNKRFSQPGQKQGSPQSAVPKTLLPALIGTQTDKLEIKKGDVSITLPTNASPALLESSVSILAKVSI
jgi:hypothetical protein